jgi:hypothetical protein
MRRRQTRSPMPPELPRRIAARRRAVLATCALLLAAVGPAAAQGVDLGSLKLTRADGELALEYSARLTLSPSLEEALQRGVPMYFTAQATVWRSRWYWRDERMAKVARTWRVAYQPLTGSWRVSLGGLSQSYGSLSQALVPLSRVSGWKLIDLAQLEPGERHYLEFSFRLDNQQLPLPMQIDVGADYKLGIERILRVD